MAARAPPRPADRPWHREVVFRGFGAGAAPRFRRGGAGVEPWGRQGRAQQRGPVSAGVRGPLPPATHDRSDGHPLRCAARGACIRPQTRRVVPRGRPGREWPPTPRRRHGAGAADPAGPLCRGPAGLRPPHRGHRPPGSAAPVDGPDAWAGARWRHPVALAVWGRINAAIGSRRPRCQTLRPGDPRQFGTVGTAWRGHWPSPRAGATNGNAPPRGGEPLA